MFWIAFAGFFFGLTYGLLQIVGEMAVFRRERLAGLSVGAYVASKVAALLPVLAAVSAVLLGVLRVLGRLPAVGWDMYALLFVTIVVEATSALALACSRRRRCPTPRRPRWRLPMLCFPQVLFGGAIVPVDQMAAPGRLMSLVLSNRHAFEALGRDLDLDRYTATLPAMSAYREHLPRRHRASLIVLASFAARPHAGHGVGAGSAVPAMTIPQDPWGEVLVDGHASLVRARRVFRYLPSAPRCKLCNNPFGGPAGRLLAVAGFSPSRKNPNLCSRVVMRSRWGEQRWTSRSCSPTFAARRRSASAALPPTSPHCSTASTWPRRAPCCAMTR